MVRQWRNGKVSVPFLKVAVPKQKTSVPIWKMAVTMISG